MCINQQLSVVLDCLFVCLFVCFVFNVDGLFEYSFKLVKKTDSE